jgi:hypothetical protein
MSKKKLAVAALLATLGLGGGVWGGMRLLKPSWPDRQAEFAAAVSANFQKSGAPNKAVADKAASCLAEALVPMAEATGCPAEGENVLEVMQACLEGSQEMQITFMMVMPECIQESLSGQ